MIDGGRNLVEVELVIVPFHYLIVAAQNLDAMFMKKFLYIYFMEMYFYLSNIIWGSFVTLQCHAAGPVFFLIKPTKIYMKEELKRTWANQSYYIITGTGTINRFPLRF